MKTLRSLILLVAIVLSLIAFSQPIRAIDTMSEGGCEAWPTGWVCQSYDTGSAALAETLAPGFCFQLLEVRVTLSSASATAENFTITMDAGLGAAYDHQLKAKDMNTVKYYTWAPTTADEQRFFEATDELDFAWTNTNTRTWGLEVKYRRIR